MSEMERHPDSLEEDLEAEEVSIEAPEADAAEQHRAIRGEEPAWPGYVPLDADPADAADQGRLVELDEEDYR